MLSESASGASFFQGESPRNYVTGPAAPERRPAGYRIESPIASVVEPLRESLHLLLGIGREEVIDGDVGRRDENRLGVREGVEPMLAVVVADARGADSSIGHRLDEQEDIGLIDGATAEGQRAHEPID